MPLRNILTLIVDDNRHAAEIVISILRSLGARDIRYASNEEDGFRTFCGERFDLAIVDQNLGKGDEGVSLVRRIRTDTGSPNCLVPIMMLTAYTQRRRVLDARDAGITEFLMKPFTAKDLVLRLGLLLDRPRAFVKSGAYFGPDRRRRVSLKYEGPEQRKQGD